MDYANGNWAGSHVIGGYPSPFMCECYLTIKLIYKMNFSYGITALELSTSIQRKCCFMQKEPY